MIRLLIATHNAHKVGEIQAVLGKDFQCLSLRDFSGAPTVIEDADTFAGNARKKAKEIANWLAQQTEVKADYVLADDSGLEVDALGGAPGVHSARFATLDSPQLGNAPDADNNAKLLRLMKDVPNQKRTARFRCALVLVAIDPKKCGCQAEGACEGRIDHAPRGKGGFGYDPLFIPNGFEVSFAELGEAVKNQISHRARALEKLRVGFKLS